MSSGAYMLVLPIDLIGGALDMMRDASARRQAEEEERRRRIAQLDAQRQRVDAFAVEVSSQMGRVVKMIDDALAAHTDYKDTTTYTHLNGITHMESTRVDSSIDTELLVFSEHEASSGKVVYVELDYSDALSASNARASTEYRKMCIASLFTKKIMALAADQNTLPEISSLLRLIDQLLEDTSVSLETFESMLEERYSYLEKSCSVPDYIDREAWMSYCAICAVRGERPRRVKSNQELKTALDDAMRRELIARYRAGAKIALAESMEELGLHVTGEAELEQISGSLYSAEDNTDYALFVNATDQGFVVEMVASGTPSAEAKQNKTGMCTKRKMLVERMRSKGYVIVAATETDEIDAPQETVKVTVSRPEKESSAERLRKRRMIAGKRPKSRAIGG